ncbi:MAG: hypothetical protein ACOCPN_01405 [Desulfonatronovibrionaceae bacterium]
MKYSDESAHKEYSVFLGPFQLFGAGFRLILSELGWSFINRFKLWEIRQLQKHLHCREQMLGKLVLASGNGPGLEIADSSEAKLMIGQAALLHEEIEQLRQELEFRRRMFVEARKKRYLDQN